MLGEREFSIRFVVNHLYHYGLMANSIRRPAMDYFLRYHHLSCPLFLDALPDAGALSATK